MAAGDTAVRPDPEGLAKREDECLRTVGRTSALCECERQRIGHA